LGSDVLENIVKDILNGKKRKFCPELRKFAVTLQYYSPKAYTYVRKTFKNMLPHPRTLRKWYTVVNGKPGFTHEAFVVLKDKCDAGPVYCNLTVDEMCIKKHIEVDTQNNVFGYIDLGTGKHTDDGDDLPLARNALVFLVVGLNDYWKLPIAYFLIDGMTGAERGNLLTKAIELISETGANINSVTFDGTHVNTSMCTSLGACFELANSKPFFLNPITKEKVFAFYDPAHMIKLIRNTLGDKKNIINGKNEMIKWEYISKLYVKEKEEGLRAGTKLTSKHIYYGNHKMNVRLAAQILSTSVSDALLFTKTKDSSFDGCNATAEFCLMFNNAFDILNARKKLSNTPFNGAITEGNVKRYEAFYEKFKIYVSQLKFEDGTLVINSKRKTGFIGLILGLKNALDLYNVLIEKGDLSYLITYKLSQDHLETFFSALRSRGGYNDNPTCRQFQASYIRLLIHNEIIASPYGNCSILDSTSITSITTPQTHLPNSIEENKLLISISDEQLFSSISNLSPFIEDITSYIAGFIAKKLETKLKCQYCIKEIYGPQQISNLATIKDRGRLKKPNKNVVKICQTAEQVFRKYSKSVAFSKRDREILVLKLKINIDISIFNQMECVNHNLHLDLLNFETHRDFLIKTIGLKYFNIRIFHEIRKLNDSCKIRQKLTKIIHFRNE